MCFKELFRHIRPRPEEIRSWLMKRVNSFIAKDMYNVPVRAQQNVKRARGKYNDQNSCAS